jgi:hypothetical protein
MTATLRRCSVVRIARRPAVTTGLAGVPGRPSDGRAGHCERPPDPATRARRRPPTRAQAARRPRNGRRRPLAPSIWSTSSAREPPVVRSARISVTLRDESSWRTVKQAESQSMAGFAGDRATWRSHGHCGLGLATVNRRVAGSSPAAGANPRRKWEKPPDRVRRGPSRRSCRRGTAGSSSSGRCPATGRSTGSRSGTS